MEVKIMIRKKGSFLTFCFSLLPGAGQMYMGFMKRGLVLMSAFFLLIFLSAFLNTGALMLIMPILWFYAFFDTHNLRSMPDDEFYALEDDFVIINQIPKDSLRIFRDKYKNIIALVLIVIGVSILWNNFFDLVRSMLPDYISNAIYNIGYYIPQLFIGAAIVALGLYLIRGKKKELDRTTEVSMLQDKGDL
jgi:hypothetical protein